MRTLVALVVSTVVVTLVAGAGLGAEPQKKIMRQPKKVMVEVTDIEFSEQPHISRDARLPQSAILVIKLSSNPGSTGFEWDAKPKMSDPSILKQLSHEFIEPKRKPGQPVEPGTPGHEVWQFKPLGPGKTVVSMEYSRPWEDGEKRVQTFKLNVTVVK